MTGSSAETTGSPNVARPDIYNVKMRAAQDSRHVSGAERLVEGDAVDEVLRSLVQRAREHPNGDPDDITLTITRVRREVLTIPALPVVEPAIHSHAEARRVLERLLAGFRLPADLLELLCTSGPMRGAMLQDVRSFPEITRLEPDRARGVRVSALDYEGRHSMGKDHFREALCLASKVAHCPHIVGEVCVSDDPGYTTGYFASKTAGYVRLPHLKRPDACGGGRIFLFDSPPDRVRECMDFLEEQPVLVTGIR